MVHPRLRPDHGRGHKTKASLFVLSLAIFAIVVLLEEVTQSRNTTAGNQRNANFKQAGDGSYMNVRDDSEVEEDCLQFGCPIYPAELTPEVYSYLKASIVRNKHQNYPFANENMLIVTQQGASHHENQDRASIIDPFMISSSSKNVVINGTLICLFDGHGVQGHIVASHVLHEFPKLLASKLEALRMSEDHEVPDAIIIQMLKESFVEVDIYGTPNFLLGGTTGSVTLRLGSKLYIANVGDSQTMVFSMPNNGTTIRTTAGPLQDVDIRFATRKDKALLPDERDRIEKLGGKIHVNPHSNESVVVVYSVAARDTIMLAMSRSIGDWEWKVVGVTAEPLVDVVHLNQLPPNSFLMAASDGVWDVRRKQFYGKQFGECFFPIEGHSGGGSVHPLAKGLEVFETITPKVQKGYRDDMTAILLAL
ncbi:unnamed protein product [Cylindrotheca closterium]|uniref:PPM-type phosphatase domain-containing protein n=1 Tax=Cylindrotheca closterium TaxID=2856 RepID=A0AAD2JHB9_9STRA|nr:unnamed protein product [Cylindrotheca closterium]